MERALALLTASATFLSAGCAARSTLPLDPSVAAVQESRPRPHLLAAATTDPAPQTAAAPPPAGWPLGNNMMPNAAGTGKISRGTCSWRFRDLDSDR